MKKELKQDKTGGVVEFPHPHNIALQLIDDKIARLIETHQHILVSRNQRGYSYVKGKKHAEFYLSAESEMDYVAVQMKQLEESKKCLLEFGITSVIERFEA